MGSRERHGGLEIGSLEDEAGGERVRVALAAWRARRSADRAQRPRIVPTPRASELAPVLERVLGELEQAIRGASFDPATTTRTFTLAVADAGQLVWLPR